MTVHAEPLIDSLVAPIRGPLWILFGAVALVMLIACTNVAGMQLARATARQREFAVRGALGGTRGRLIAQGDAATIQADPKVQETYFGSGRMLARRRA